MIDRPVNVRIGHLALQGLSPADSARFATSLRREMAQLLSNGLTSPAPHAIEGRVSVDAGSVTRGATPEAIGVQVARAVYERLAQ